MEILSVTHDYWAWICMIFFGFVALLLFTGAWNGQEKKKWLQTVICSLLAIGVFMGGMVFCNNAANKKILKVTVTDWNKVDFTKYKITGNEGKIITLQEK